MAADCARACVSETRADYYSREPTSALDPWAEADWLERFRQLAVGRTSIIITHRFTTAMHADVIHVMDQGRIVESGSHQRLLEQNGLYAESWTRQMILAADDADKTDIIRVIWEKSDES